MSSPRRPPRGAYPEHPPATLPGFSLRVQLRIGFLQAHPLDFLLVKAEVAPGSCPAPIGIRRHTDTGLLEDAHNVCVLSGHVKVVFVTETVYLKPGDTYDFDGARRHSIQAVTPGACVLNLFLAGQPEAYRGLPASELKGEFDVREFNR